MKIVIFDGACGFCNQSVKRLIALDRHKIFRYTSLQGKFLKTLSVEPNSDSVIFYDDGILYYKSSAVLKILHSLGGFWVMITIFYVIPRFIRDAVYDGIAKYRYKLSDKQESCRMIYKQEQDLFLD